MVTMPIAGFLADKIGPGKVVLTGIVLDTIGMGMLIGIGATTPYSYIITAFVIMGLGMGATMMPVFTAALASLRDHDIARGSTLMNITQQIAISMGTAMFSVLLTNAYNAHEKVVAPTLALQNGATPASLGLSEVQAKVVQVAGLHFMGQSFGDVFLVATVLVGLCLVPAFFLPRKPPRAPHRGGHSGRHDGLIDPLARILRGCVPKPWPSAWRPCSGSSAAWSRRSRCRGTSTTRSTWAPHWRTSRARRARAW